MEKYSPKVIEKILDRKVDVKKPKYGGSKTKVYYLIKWKDWNKPTWEFKENCNCKELIKDFEKELLADEKREKR